MNITPRQILVPTVVALLTAVLFVVLLFFGTAMGLGRYAGAMTGALAGSAVMLLLLLFFSRIVRGTAMLLITGILLGYLASSAISLLSFYATQEGVHSYVI